MQQLHHTHTMMLLILSVRPKWMLDQGSPLLYSVSSLSPRHACLPPAQRTHCVTARIIAGCTHCQCALALFSRRHSAHCFKQSAPKFVCEWQTRVHLSVSVCLFVTSRLSHTQRELHDRKSQHISSNLGTCFSFSGLLGAVHQTMDSC